MKELVTISNNEAVTTTLTIADGVGRPHQGVIQLIRQHQADFEEFGRVAFEMRPFDTPGGPQNREYAILNERQATLLLTYLRNTEVVKRFKIALVKAFFAMAEALQRPRESAEPGLLVRMVEATTRMYQTINDRLDRIERGTAQRMLEHHLNSQGKKPVRYETTDIRIFVTCQCEEGSDESVRKTELHERYRTWCKERRLDFYGYGSFCQALRQACPDLRDGVVRLPGSGRQSPVFYGICLKTLEEPGEEVQS